MWPPGLLIYITYGCPPLDGAPATISCPPSLPGEKSHHSQTPKGETPPLPGPLVERSGGPGAPWDRPHRAKSPLLCQRLRAGSKPHWAVSTRQMPQAPLRGWGRWAGPRCSCPFSPPNLVSLINTFPLLLTHLIWPEAAQSFKKKKKKRQNEGKPGAGPPGWQGADVGGSPETHLVLLLQNTPHAPNSRIYTGGGPQHTIHCGPSPAPSSPQWWRAY